MTLTFYDLYEKLPAPYESVLTKAFKHGRVTVARNMSQAIADATVKASAAASGEASGEAAAVVLVDCVRQIAKEVSRICKEAASAKEFDRPFMMLRNVSRP